jgi:hypothetical protein
MPKKIAFLLLGVTLGAWSCGGGGCGEEPHAATAAAEKATDGRASGGSAGGAAVGGGAPSASEEKPKSNPDGSRFDTAGAQGSSTGASDQAREAAHEGEGAKKFQKLAGPQTIFDVDPPGFSRVLSSQAPALVIVAGGECADCALAMPALRTLSRELRGKWEFYRIDPSAVGASGVLPAGTIQPPSFIIYDGGKPASSRAGLPFARELAAKDRPEEPLEDYQRRLYRWFRDALTQKNLKFGSI